MKTFIQLVIAALIINASFQAARSYWNFYRLEEEVREEILHGRQSKFSELHLRVTEIAAERGIDRGVRERRGESSTRAARHRRELQLRRQHCLYSAFLHSPVGI